jgi:hypothetical protein
MKPLSRFRYFSIKASVNLSASVKYFGYTDKKFTKSVNGLSASLYASQIAINN